MATATAPSVDGQERVDAGNDPGRLDRNPEQVVRLPHVPALDGLRGLSIVMVMAYHAGFRFADGGFLGVDVFFVLSGFLITSLLMEEWQRTRTASLKNFYARRGLRLLPALFVLLSVVSLAPSTALGVEDGAAWTIVLIVLIYMANWFMTLDVGALGTLTHTWSLSIEEQFYLLWPPLLIFLLRRRIDRRWLVAAVALGVVAVWVERVLLYVAFDTLQPRLYYGTDTRADGLLLGCLVGVLAAQGMLPTAGQALVWVRHAGVAALGALLFLAYYARVDTDVALGWSIPASLAAAVLLVSLLIAPPPLATRILEQKTLIAIGRISYGLYLWHVPVFHGFMRTDLMAALGVSGIALHVGRFAAAFAVAGASFLLVERPMLKLKSRFRSGAAATVTVDREKYAVGPIVGGPSSA